MTEPLAVEPAPALEINRHLMLYSTTRAALIGLAETVPWNGLLDYDVVLELLDGLHDQFDTPRVQAPSAVSKRFLYDAARSGINALTRYGINASALAVCRGILDMTWAADPHHTTVDVGGVR